MIFNYTLFIHHKSTNLIIKINPFSFSYINIILIYTITPLDGFLADTEAVSRLLFVQHTALYQHLLDIEYTVQSTITHSSFSFSAHCNTVQQQSQFFV